MPSPTEKALKEIAKELRAGRKERKELGSAIDGLRVALAEFHSDVKAQQDSQRAISTGLSERVVRAERALKLRPA